MLSTSVSGHQTSRLEKVKGAKYGSMGPITRANGDEEEQMGSGG